MDLSQAALLIIDMQAGIRDPRWFEAGPRNNPDAEARMADLLAAWRGAGRRALHVRHEGSGPGSAFSGAGFEFLEALAPRADDAVLTKRARSAFAGTDLEARLRAEEISTLVLCGVITNNSVEATARHGSDIGFDVIVAEDACYTFAKRDGARLWSAEDVHALSLANLRGEYAHIASSADIVAAV